MKKLLALILVLTLVLGMGVGVYAVDNVLHEDYVPIIKTLTKTGVNPAETFNFKVAFTKYAGEAAGISGPAIGDFSIDVAGEAVSGTTNLPIPAADSFPALGVYTYTITELVGNTAGFGYTGGPNDLIITVTNNPQYEGDKTLPKFLRTVTMTDEGIKVDDFVNTFNSGDLEITKTVTGNLGNKDRYFNVTVTLTAPQNEDLSYKVVKLDKVGITGGNYNASAVTEFVAGKSVVKLEIKHGDTITIANLPYGVTWDVSEEDYFGEGYTTTIANEKGTIGELEGDIKVNIVNHKETNINTGVNLDNLPYILIIGAAAVGLVGFTMKRRLSDDK